VTSAADRIEAMALELAQLAAELRAPAPDPWVDAKTASALGLRPATFRRLCRDGSIAAVVGPRRKLLARRCDVERWLASRPSARAAEMPADDDELARRVASGELRKGRAA
jgi:hypothetical protein